MRLEAIAKAGYYPTPPSVVDLIAERLRPTGRLKILDPCAGEGEALRSLYAKWAMNFKIQTYAVELEHKRASAARKRVNNLLRGDIFNADIAQNRFNLLFLNPPYDTDAEGGRLEQKFLTRCTPYLMHGGVLVYIVPRRRLADAAAVLATYYDDLRCWEFPHPEIEMFDQVVLIGKRKQYEYLDPHSEGQLKTWAMRPDMLTPLDDGIAASGRYSTEIPEAATARVRFRMRRMDTQRALRDARRTGLWADRTFVDGIMPRKDRRVRPLMPLGKGHLAMLAISGMFDNLVFESNGHRYALKGASMKQWRDEGYDEIKNKHTRRQKPLSTLTVLDLDTGEYSDIQSEQSAN